MEKDEWIGNSIMSVMYKVLPKTSYDLKVEKYLWLFDVFKLMYILSESYCHGSFNEMLGRFVFLLELNHVRQT